MTTAISYDAILDSNADEAYERVLPEALALEPDALLQVNIDVSTALVTAMSIVANLPHLERLMRELPEFPLDKVERFPDYVLALLSAQSRYAFAVAPPKQEPALLEEGVERRDILIADAEALIARKLLDSGCLRELTRGHGYKNVAFDLSGLTRLMKTAWPTIEGQTGLKLAELAEVDKLALRLMTVVARREQSPEAIAEASTIRQRMYTLFYNAYTQLRRAATYQRWLEDDVDEFVPSIFAGRTNAKAGRTNGGDASAQAGASEPTVADPGEAAPLGSEAAVGVAPRAGAPTNGNSESASIGFPGARPYTAA